MLIPGSSTTPGPEQDAAKGVRLHSHAARQMGEMYLIKETMWNIGAVMDFSRVGFQRVAATDRDHANEAVQRMIFRDCIIQFYECFQKGGGPKKYKLCPKEVFGDNAAVNASFKAIEALRNGFAAHRHGPSQQAPVYVLLDEEFNPTHLRCMPTMPLTWTEPHARAFQQMATVAYLAADRRIGELKVKLDAEVAALTVDQLKAMPEATFTVPGDADLTKSRDQHDGLTKGRVGPLPGSKPMSTRGASRTPT